jgi:hypothetical protein
MLQQGFDYAYDKRLYDRLRDGHARPAREHLHAGLDYQARLARFMENHDEPRAAATFPPGMHEAAAVITYLSPGLRFFHQGQFEGRKKRISPHLVRAPLEAVDEGLRGFYEHLLAVLRDPSVRDGQWQLLECAPAWDGNGTWDNFIAWSWQAEEGRRRVIAVNCCGNPGPVLRPPALRRPRRAPGTACGPDEPRSLRPRWKRSGVPRSLPGCAAMELSRVRVDDVVTATGGVFARPPKLASKGT